MTVWKAILQAKSAPQSIVVPEGAELLCAHAQFDQVCVWYRCDPAKPKVRREVVCVLTGTNSPTPETGRYLGTAILHGGNYVVHVFERIP